MLIGLDLAIAEFLSSAVLRLMIGISAIVILLIGDNHRLGLRSGVSRVTVVLIGLDLAIAEFLSSAVLRLMTGISAIVIFLVLSLTAP